MELFSIQGVFRITIVAILFNTSLSSLKCDNQGGDMRFASSMVCSVRAGASCKAQQNNLMITGKWVTKRATLISFPQTQANVLEE